MGREVMVAAQSLAVVVAIVDGGVGQSPSKLFPPKKLPSLKQLGSPEKTAPQCVLHVPDAPPAPKGNSFLGRRLNLNLE